MKIDVYRIKFGVITDVTVFLNIVGGIKYVDNVLKMQMFLPINIPVFAMDQIPFIILNRTVVFNAQDQLE